MHNTPALSKNLLAQISCHYSFYSGKPQQHTLLQFIHEVEHHLFIKTHMDSLINLQSARLELRLTSSPELNL